MSTCRDCSSTRLFSFINVGDIDPLYTLISNSSHNFQQSLLYFVINEIRNNSHRHHHHHNGITTLPLHSLPLPLPPINPPAAIPLHDQRPSHRAPHDQRPHPPPTTSSTPFSISPPTRHHHHHHHHSASKPSSSSDPPPPPLPNRLIPTEVGNPRRLRRPNRSIHPLRRRARAPRRSLPLEPSLPRHRRHGPLLLLLRQHPRGSRSNGRRMGHSP